MHNNENLTDYNINNINKNEEKKVYIKSSTYNNNPNINTYINNLNDNPNNDRNLQKARTSHENENFNRASFTLRINNLYQNHLETVLEAVSEASNSKIDSSEISDDEENNDNNKNNIKNDTKESGKNKEESGTITSKQKNQQTDAKINENEYYVTNKKSLYFLSSEKTH